MHEYVKIETHGLGFFAYFSKQVTTVLWLKKMMVGVVKDYLHNETNRILLGNNITMNSFYVQREYEKLTRRYYDDLQTARMMLEILPDIYCGKWYLYDQDDNKIDEIENLMNGKWCSHNPYLVNARKLVYDLTPKSSKVLYEVESLVKQLEVSLAKLQKRNKEEYKANKDMTDAFGFVLDSLRSTYRQANDNTEVVGKVRELLCLGVKDYIEKNK